MTHATDETDARHLRVLIADENRDALRELGAVLEELGHEVAPYVVSVAEAIERIGAEDPDLAIVVVHENDDHALALIEETVEYASGPVLAKTTVEDVDIVTSAAERGIAAWIETLTPERVQAAIEIAMRRYRERARLETKVEQLETALERRAVIERAKGILMERRGIDERAAFELLRDHARSNSRRVVDMAAAVGEGQALLPPG